MKPVVVFRQSGNNLRLGNTLVWVAAARDWCDRHGFEFCFPAGQRIIGPLVHPASPLLELPAAVRSSWLAEGPQAPAERFAAIDALLARLLTTAREMAPRLGLAPPLVTLVPDALGCIVDSRGCEWESAALLDFVRAHRACIVNEPHPFTLPAPVSAGVLGSLLAPSPEAQAIMAAATAGGGVGIGVHIRQTDYRRWQDGKFFRDNDFYNELLGRTVPLLGPGSRLFVAHDGEFEADPALLAHPRVKVSGGSEAEVVQDFVRFAACDFLVGPQSTFTVQAMRIGNLWLPKQRDLIHLRPETTVDGLFSSLRSRLAMRSVPCP